MNIELKPLTAELLPAIVELDRLCLGGLWSLEGYQRELESPNSDLLILQAERDEQPTASTALHPSTPPPLLGYACLWSIADEAHITILAVHPAYQRQGLGQALLVALLNAAHQRQLKWATLEVRASNCAAIALYQQFGFQEAGRRKRYYQDNGEDALILWRSGLQHPEFVRTLKRWQHQVDDRLRQGNWMISNSLFPILNF